MTAGDGRTHLGLHDLAPFMANRWFLNKRSGSKHHQGKAVNHKIQPSPGILQLPP